MESYGRYLPFPALLLALLSTAPAGAVTITPSVDLILTHGRFRAETSVQGVPAGDLTQDLPGAAFDYTQTFSDGRESAWWPDPTSARAVASADIDVHVVADTDTGDVIFSGAMTALATADSNPDCDEFGCAYPDDAVAAASLRYGIWFDLLVPMNYWLRVEVDPGLDDNPGPWFEFNSLVRSRNVARVDGSDGNLGEIVVYEGSGQLSDGYHELLGDLVESAGVPGYEDELSRAARGTIRYWLSINPEVPATPVPAPAALILLATGLGSLLLRARRRT